MSCILDEFHECTEDPLEIGDRRCRATDTDLENFTDHLCVDSKFAAECFEKIGIISETRFIKVFPSPVPPENPWGLDEGTVLLLRGVPGRVVLGTGPLPPKLERLARLLAEASDEVAEAARIDLRFGDRVVLGGGPSPDGSEAAVARKSGERPVRGRSG